MKIITHFVLTVLSFFKIVLAENCFYFPGYPDTSYSYTVNCAHGCCGGYSSSASAACCNQGYYGGASNGWLAFPIIGGIFILVAVLVILVCAYRFNQNLRDKTTAFLTGEKPRNNQPQSIGSELFRAETGMNL